MSKPVAGPPPGYQRWRVYACCMHCMYRNEGVADVPAGATSEEVDRHCFPLSESLAGGIIGGGWEREEMVSDEQ